MQTQGLFAIWGKGDCLKDLLLGTSNLQDQGKDYAGLATTNGDEIKIRTHRGLVIPSFKNDLSGLEGNSGLGVTSSTDRQPMLSISRLGEFAIGADYSITNVEDIKNYLFHKGHSVSTRTDVELLSHLICENYNIGEGIKSAIDKVAGPCNIVVLCPEGIYGACDLHGFKPPLSIGKKDDQWAISSTTSALNRCGFEFVRDIEPGEVIFIGEDGLVSLHTAITSHRQKRCSFEFTHAEPDSRIYQISVAKVQHNLGRSLAEADEKEFDFSPSDTVVGSVPNSSNNHVEGYCCCSDLPHLELFKVPEDYKIPLPEREKQKALELFPVVKHIKGKKIVFVVNSVRPDIISIIGMLNACGAKEVHMRISCPKQICCPFDHTPKEEGKLIAATMKEDEICQLNGVVSSLRFQKVERLTEAIGRPVNELCVQCFGDK